MIGNVDEERYFVISNSDGETYVSWYTKKGLLSKLEERYWGDVDPLTLGGLTIDGDPACWEGRPLIIKGFVAKVTPPTTNWGIE